jgi:hypothetical protein
MVFFTNISVFLKKMLDIFVKVCYNIGIGCYKNTKRNIHAVKNYSLFGVTRPVWPRHG